MSTSQLGVHYNESSAQTQALHRLYEQTQGNSAEEKGEPSNQTTRPTVPGQHNAAPRKMTWATPRRQDERAEPCYSSQLPRTLCPISNHWLLSQEPTASEHRGEAKAQY